ncbi:MAG: cytochrome c biogenesis CcdA family protein [Salinispira sp.]
MQNNVNIFIAFFAGLISFVSPCVLPLVPSYISFIGGQRELTSSRKSLIFKTFFFIFGFTVVFLVMGIVFSGTAAAFSGAIRWINIVAGTVVILFGLNLLFNFLTFLNYEKRFHFSKAPAGAGGAMLLGMAFAAGWSPCIGPILASILALAAGTGSLSSGIVLLGAYSLGLALPFLLTSIFLSQAQGAFQKIKPHMRTIQRVSGVVLIVIGVLMIFGQYQQITSWLSLMSFRLKRWDSMNMRTSALLFSGIFFLCAFLAALPLIRKKQKVSALRIVIIVFFLVIAVLQLAGLLQFPLLLSSWLNFQGI